MAELNIKAELGKLDEVIDFVNAGLEANDCPMKIRIQIDVAVEEMFVNICHYAYTPDKGSALISFEFDEQARNAVITFNDTGVPFDPTASPDPDINAPASERQIGGLGIYMVKKSMDKMLYRYENGHNILTIVKAIG